MPTRAHTDTGAQYARMREEVDFSEQVYVNNNSDWRFTKFLL
jgi:hypothetical protein